MSYPTIVWINEEMRYSPYAARRVKILEAFIVGSEAKGTAKPDSDLDIALVIEPVKGKTSIKYSEYYHQKFPSDDCKPKWNGRRVDFQFFYPDDPQLATYSKIPIERGEPRKKK